MREVWLGALLALSLGGAARGDGLQLVVEADGLPGLEAGAPARQLCSVSGESLRLLEPGRGRAIHLDLARRRVVEVDLLRRAVRERAWDELEGGRALARRRALETWHTRRSQALERGDASAVRALDGELRRSGLRADGAVVVSLERTRDTRQATLEVDGAPRRVLLERWLLRENEAERPLAEVWTAPELQLPGDAFAPWRGLPLLGSEAAAHLARVPGMIVEARLLLPDEGPAWSLRVLAVQRAPGLEPQRLAPPPWRG